MSLQTAWRLEYSADSKICSSSPVSEPLLPNNKKASFLTQAHLSCSAPWYKHSLCCQTMIQLLKIPESESASICQHKYKSGIQCTLDTQSVSPSEWPCLQTMAIANVIDENASGIVPYNPSDAANNYL